LRGNPEAHYQRIRSKYRRLRERGELPKPSLERNIDALKDAFRRRAEVIEQARRELADAEQRVRSLGLDLDQDLDNLSVILRNKRASLQDLLNDPAEWQAARLFSQGLRDPDEAARYIRECHQQIQTLDSQIEALSHFRRLRDISRQSL
jgi:exonuclease VII small subunit